MAHTCEVRVPDPPNTPKRVVVDTVHGVKIEDPYRWLEDGLSAEVREWTHAQNARTNAVFRQLPERRQMAQRLLQLMSRDMVGSPVLRGGKLFFTKRIHGKNQPVLMVMEPPHLQDAKSSPRVLVDPNRASAEGIVALDWWHPSPDGSMLAYGLSERGDEWSVLHILDVATGELLPETIERARYAGVTWKPDNQGFYYGKYPKPGEVPPGEENYNRHIFFHKLGTDPENDPKVFGEGRPKEQSYGTSLSNDGKYLLLTVSHGWNSTDLFFRREDIPGAEFIPIVEGEDASFYGRIIGETLYMATNLEAPKYMVVAVDLNNPAMENWKTIIPESDDMTIDRIEFAKGHIIISGLRHAVSHMHIYTLDGKHVREVPLPTLGTVTGITASLDSSTFYFRFESFLIPPAIYRFGIERDETPEVVLESATGVDPGLASLEQVFYHSKDGTRVPMFIVKRRGLDLSEKQPVPTVLSGYGGFNISRTPEYSPAILPWIEAGGIYASANLRGGSEYGEDWHRAGMLGNKQNVFDDFIYAGKYLIEKGYTDAEHLGILGRSNGGLLVGAALTQRPDLFRAVACGVPLLDMVRYHKFLIAYLWCSEYGDPDDPQAFKWLYAYSPYHNVKENVSYPATYIYTAESDTRVDPMHARKMTALLQDASSRTPSKGPILLTVEADAGHGVGKPLHKVVDEQANIWGFFAWQLGLELGQHAHGL
ncbi:MAG: prolyl oligopeptidase family serine peptidase [Bacillota bacterium]